MLHHATAIRAAVRSHSTSPNEALVLMCLMLHSNPWDVGMVDLSMDQVSEFTRLSRRAVAYAVQWLVDREVVSPALARRRSKRRILLNPDGTKIAPSLEDAMALMASDSSD